jgi:hypothetical protein
MSATHIKICDGGTVKAENGKAKIILQNDHDKECNVSDLNLPNANPPGPYKVGKKNGSNPGQSKEITFDGIPGKQYPYSADCCKNLGNPVIIVQ